MSKLQTNVIRTSLVQAINRTINKAKTTASKLIRNEANLKVNYINEKLKPTKATRYNLLARIDTTSAKATNLIEYVRGDISRFRRRTKRGRFTKTAQRGVTAKPYKKTKAHKGAFIGTGKNSGKQLVFKRTGPGRNAKLAVVHGPSMRQIFQRDTTKQKIKARIDSEIIKEFNSAFNNNLTRQIKP